MEHMYTIDRSKNGQSVHRDNMYTMDSIYTMDSLYTMDSMNKIICKQ